MQAAEDKLVKVKKATHHGLHQMKEILERSNKKQFTLKGQQMSTVIDGIDFEKKVQKTEPNLHNNAHQMIGRILPHDEPFRLEETDGAA